MSSPPPAVKRKIDSPLRREQAALTRRRIVAAASALFAERGYLRTSIEDIASAAAVGRATVFKAVGGKPVLLKLAFDVAIAGDDAPVPVRERPETKRVVAEADPYAAVEVFCRGVAERASRMAPIYWSIVEAAGADDQVRRLAEELDAQRDRGSELFLADLVRKSPLRSGLDRRRAAQILSVHLEPAAFRTLVLRHGWTVHRFAAWLADTITHQLLPPRPAPRTRAPERATGATGTHRSR